MHTEMLQQLGMPKNEAKIYEALLMLGMAGAADISNTAKVNRRNVYDSLKNLVVRRLVVRVMGAGESVYKAENPKVLQGIIDAERAQVDTLLPELKKMFKANIPDEQIFISRGKEGIKNFWQYVLSQKGPSYFVAGKGAWHDPAIESQRRLMFHAARHKSIAIQSIFDHEVFERESDVYSQYEPDSIRFFPKGCSTKANFDICGNRVVLFTMPHERSVENVTIFNIISKPLADSYRTWFQYLWERATPLVIPAKAGIQKEK